LYFPFLLKGRYSTLFLCSGAFRRLSAIRPALWFKALVFFCTLFLPLSKAKAESYWDWQLSAPFDLNRSVKIYALDPDNVSRRQIEALKNRDIKTVCYVSIGTLENYREDVADFPANIIGKTYEEWPDERFLDIRRHDLLFLLMRARFQRCKDRGFDAIEPDNMDVHDNESGCDVTREDMLSYILGLAEIAHDMGLEFAQKNVPELTAPLAAKLDFIIMEECYKDGWCEDALPYLRLGKDVLDAEYRESGTNRDAACAYAGNHGIKMIFKTLDLTADLWSCVP